MANSGAILGRFGTPLATAGSWPVEPALTLPIAGDGPMATLALGPRADGAPPDPAVVFQLQELAGLVALAAGRGVKARRR